MDCTQVVYQLLSVICRVTEFVMVGAGCIDTLGLYTTSFGKQVTPGCSTLPISQTVFRYKVHIQSTNDRVEFCLALLVEICHA